VIRVVKTPAEFAVSSRVLHWSMALMVLSMFFIGAAMVTSLADYHVLLSIHRPLGIAILALVVLRYLNRRLKPPPDFLETMSGTERVLVVWSERLLYGLMFVLPLVGWGMLSAARYPIVLMGAVHLPPILPRSAHVYSLLRTSHTVLAYLFFLAVLAHLTGALFHALVLRDGILRRMTWPRSPRRGATPGGQRSGAADVTESSSR
jgi:cytochrome b561